MTTRTHLSIGEVLSLLTDDFPDLTITKIRFLESQGLIDPERTASGYRKFYDADIERLRWILRQQRENFLPLKVIKDRLDRSDGKPAVTAVGDGSSEPGQAELDLARDPGSTDPPPVWMADHAARDTATAEASAKVADVPSADAPSDSTATSDAATGHTPVSDPPHFNGLAPQSQGPGGPEMVKATPTHDSKPESLPKPATPPKPATTPVGAVKPPPKTAPKPPAKPGPQPSGPVVTSSASHERTEASMAAPESTSKTSTTASAGAPSPSSAGDVSDVSLTRDELLAAAHLDDRQLTQLESFGIVVASDAHGDPIYGSEALICARQAATFMKLGLEPRHLRAFKVAADREAGLYEQLVMPLLRQRNPAARSEAGQVVGQLTSAGTALHAALLRQALRSQLRPRR